MTGGRIALLAAAFALAAWVPAAASAEDLGWWDRITGVGKPLLLGLTVFACGFGALVYLGVGWIWRWRVLSRRHRRLSGPSGR